MKWGAQQGWQTGFDYKPTGTIFGTGWWWRWPADKLPLYKHEGRGRNKVAGAGRNTEKLADNNRPRTSVAGYWCWMFV